MPTPTTDRWSEVLTARFLRAETKVGRTAKEIAASVGCSENTVRDHLARHGLLDVEAPKQVAKDYDKLGSITAVAHHHDVSFATARRWLLSAGVELNEAHRPELAGIDIDGAAHRYESGESLAAIARDLGIGVNTLKRRLEAHGVQMRARGPQPKAL
jgi:transposase-like protein